MTCQVARPRTPWWVRGERGSASMQAVVLLPIVFAIMFLGVQAALHYHARTVALAAAEEGARAAAAHEAHGSDGTAAAASFVSAAGGDDVLQHAAVTGRRTATTATVTVTGTALSVIPGWKPRISQTATMPVERLTRP